LPIDFYEKSKNQLDLQKIAYDCKVYDNLFHNISYEEVEDLVGYIKTIISEN